MPEVRRGSRSTPVRSESSLFKNTSQDASSSRNDIHAHTETAVLDNVNSNNSTGSRKRVSIAADTDSKPKKPQLPPADPRTSTRSLRLGGDNTTTINTQSPVDLQRPPRRKSTSDQPNSPLSPTDHSRRSLSYALRPPAEAYYDSRAATRKEWKRRAKTLEEYYDDNPNLLPQLPFTWHHGWRRWKLFIFAFLVFVDGSAVPIALYYGMHYAGDVAGWIIFAVVTTIWGGPTYLEFAIRTFRLIKKERFYRPLGTDSRWCFDMLTYASVVTITAVTALFVVGSAPHIVFLRVLCMPAPAILYCLCGVMALISLYHQMGWKAPFRISSTAKGEPVLPGVYYFIEDVAAVNGNAGRPFREALAARYKASPRFQRMLYVQSWFWSVPGLVLAIALTVVAVIHDVPATAAYGVCWAVPFLWTGIWGGISVWWCKRDMVRERLEWEADNGVAEKGTSANAESGDAASSTV